MYDISKKVDPNHENFEIFWINTSLAAKGALAHRLQRRSPCNTKMADGVLGILSNFR